MKYLEAVKVPKGDLGPIVDFLYKVCVVQHRKILSEIFGKIRDGNRDLPRQQTAIERILQNY